MTLPLKSIAIAEDDITVTRCIERVVSQHGYKVVGTAANGIDALHLVRTQQPHLIIMDIHMPVMEGLEAAKQIIALETTAVVMVTADTDPSLARQALDLGVAGYILKPCQCDQIVPLLESSWHRFQTIRSLRQEMRQLTETLETRKLLDKAKGILMEQQGFSEQEAHQTIQKMAQDQGLTIKELCRSLIQVKMILGSKTKAKKNAA